MAGRVGPRSPRAGFAPWRPIRPEPNGSALPRLTPSQIDQRLTRLNQAQARFAMAHRLLPLPCGGYAAGDEMAARFARARKLPLVARLNPGDLRACLCRHYTPMALRAARASLFQAQPRFSAAIPLSVAQKCLLPLLVCTCLALGLAAPELTGATLSTFIFLPIAGLRWLSFALPAPRLARIRLTQDRLPDYSVLVPVYREAAVLPQLIASLHAIDYPPDRLDVKIITEADDTETAAALRLLALPAHFEIIRVPPSQPRTKPKALNFALAFARGSLVTIYDAEDVPDRQQLRHAAEVFAASKERLGCLQARLCFYNGARNWLTEQFSLEYAALFDLLLPLLSRLGLPVPLGGTSNHFRVDVLQRLGGWDPYNVTEDADLGLRLARLGYHTRIIRSSTAEEAVDDLRTWRSQRARWLKGWMQTWAVHSRDPRRAIVELGLARFLAMQVIMAGMLGAVLFYPIFTLGFLHFSFSGRLLTPETSASELIAYVWSFFVFLAGHSFMMGAAAEGAKRRLGGWRFAALASMPLYWVLMSWAGWLAAWQFIRRPFHWNKTPHKGGFGGNSGAGSGNRTRAFSLGS